MKTLLSFLLVLVLLLSTGCGNTSDDTLAPETESQTESETEAAAPDTEPTPETEPSPGTEALQPREPIVLSAEMQQKYGSYISADWKNKLASITIEDEETFAFLLQTDTHFSVNSGTSAGNNAKALSHFIPLDFIAHTGDFVKGYSDATENSPENTAKSMDELFHRYTEDVNCPVLITFGNHDTNQIWCKEHGSASDQLSQADHYEKVTAKLLDLNGDNMVTNGESPYYYVDFPYDRVHVIMLSSSDSNYETGYGSLSSISDGQVTWFESVALDTDYSVIVMIHVPLYSYFPDNSSWTVINGRKITAAVNRFVSSGGDFIAYMYGHTHNQSDMVDRDGRLHISFKSGSASGEIVTIDFANRKIITYGLGSAVDREFDY